MSYLYSNFRIKKSYSNGDKWENGTILTILKVNAKEHQGNYTCAPSTLTPSSVVVHIIDEGKMPQDAAVYDSFDSSSSTKEMLNFFYLQQFSTAILIMSHYNLLWLVYLNDNWCLLYTLYIYQGSNYHARIKEMP